MLEPSSMTLRKKARTNYADLFKLQKQPKPEKVQEETNENFEKLRFGVPGDQIPGASYLKFEVHTKKGQKVLVPVRYSIRN